MGLFRLCVLILCVCIVFETNAEDIFKVNKIESKPIARRSDGLTRHLVDILVEEKQERQNLRNDNRQMKAKMDDIMRELRQRNVLLGDAKFKLKKLIKEVKSTKADLKSELEKELKKYLSNFSSTLKELKAESNYNLQKTKRLSRDIKSLMKTDETLTKNLTNVTDRLQTVIKEKGAVYVRYGKKSCPNDTELVYSGQLAMSHHSGKGGPTNYQCLPDDPDWRFYESGMQPNSAIYGVEFETNYYHEGELLDKKYYNYDVVCAVCQSNHRRAMIMIPGKSKCTKGWHLEYRGYLMSGYIGHSASEYICVDANPDTEPGTNGDNNGALIYNVEAGCTSMKCPPYISGRELTCAVCTK